MKTTENIKTSPLEAHNGADEVEIERLKVARAELLIRLTAGGEDVGASLDEIEDALERAERAVRRQAERVVIAADLQAKREAEEAADQAARRTDAHRAAMGAAQGELAGAVTVAEATVEKLLAELQRYVAAVDAFDLAAIPLGHKPRADKARRALSRYLGWKLHAYADIARPPHDLRQTLSDSVRGVLEAAP